MHKKIKIGIISAVTIVVVVSILIGINWYQSNSWGEKGTLVLSISADKAEMDINDSINITYTIKNTGDTNLRVIYSPLLPTILIYDSYNNKVNWTGPPMAPPPPPTNKDLQILNSGGAKSFEKRIFQARWDIKENMTYRIIGFYHVDKHDEITLLYWTGEISSNEIFFKVT